VLDLELWHWEVANVARREPRPGAYRGRRDQAIALGERDPARIEPAAPRSGHLSLARAERNDPKRCDQSVDPHFFLGSYPAPELLDVDRADERRCLRATQLTKALHGWSSPQRIDQDRGVQEERDSAHPIRVGPALCPHPARRIVIPLVALSRDCPERSQDLIPAALVVQSPAKELRDEGAPPSLPDPLIQFGHEFILEAYV
jgi:hypothetical protein